jgi:hypothetical protein
MLAVRHRRLDAHVEKAGHLLVAAPFGDELQHLTLAFGQ